MITHIEKLHFEKYLSHIMLKTPSRVLRMFSYYKFVANFIPSGKKILEIGCNEGFGVPILAEKAASLTAVDFDLEAIENAKKLWKNPKIEFLGKDFRDLEENDFDVVASFDVVEHIFPENFPDFYQSFLDKLTQEGILVIGMPSLEQQQHASKLTRQGHVNCMNGATLENWLKKGFKHTFVFSGNDEVVHTGFWPMATYLIGIGYYKK